MGDLRPGWTRVKFGQVVRLNKDSSPDPKKDGVDRYVGLEHIEPGDLRIRSWGDVADGTTFTNRFRPGHVLFGKRRAYQRKVAAADFEGVCSGDIYVFEPKDPRVLLAELLPFICQADSFFDHAVGTSAGSLSPRTNWKSLADYELALPPLEEQRRIANILRLADNAAKEAREAVERAEAAYVALGNHLLVRPERVAGSGDPTPKTWAFERWPVRRLGELNDPAAPICYGIVKLGDTVPSGVPVLRTENLNGDYSDLRWVSPKLDHEYRRSRVQGRDILLAIQGASTGKIGRVPDGFEGNINRHLARLRCSEALSPSYFYHLWNTTSFSRYITAVSTGTTKPELTIGALRMMEVPVPPRQEQDEIASQLGELQAARQQLACRRAAASGLLRSLIGEVLELSAVGSLLRDLLSGRGHPDAVDLFTTKAVKTII